MPRRHLLGAASVGVALAILGTGIAAQTAVAAPPTTVDLRVELDLLTPSGEPLSRGPAVFAVEDATIGSGPELTGADLAENPSGWYGSLQVDVDTSTTPMTITVQPDDSGDFTDVVVTVGATDLCPIAVVQDDLFAGSERPVALTVDCTADVLTAAWTVDQTGAESTQSEFFAGATIFSSPAASPEPSASPSPSASPEPSVSPAPSASAEPLPSPSLEPAPSPTPDEVAPTSSAVAPVPTTPAATPDERAAATLPETGSSPPGALLAGALLLLVAGGIVLARRRVVARD